METHASPSAREQWGAFLKRLCLIFLCHVSWDEWVGTDRLLKHTERSQRKQQQLLEEVTVKGSGGKKAPKAPSPFRYASTSYLSQRNDSAYSLLLGHQSELRLTGVMVMDRVTYL